MFDLARIFKEAVDVVKRNYILAVPTVIASFVVTFLALALLKSPENVGAMALIGFLGLVLDFFAHAITVAMAREAFQKGHTSLKTGMSVASSFFIHLFATAAAIAILVSLGFMLLIVPGLAAMFFMMFAFPAIIMHGIGPVEAIKSSYRLVRANLNESLILFVAIAGITVGVGLVNLVLSTIPVIGQFISVILTGLLGGFSAVAVLRTYLILEAKSALAK